ncbi:hypothetical protein DFJ77DRAFT_433259 [Powellomyces hirtus]|nr:hypothetical protein DFJ77DRAFT_433259 [Powellomyces hirtus]
MRAGNRILPQWQMWLRHTREAAPTIQELQQAEAQRLLTKSRARELVGSQVGGTQIGAGEGETGFFGIGECYISGG